MSKRKSQIKEARVSKKKKTRKLDVFDYFDENTTETLLSFFAEFRVMLIARAFPHHWKTILRRFKHVIVPKGYRRWMFILINSEDELLFSHYTSEPQYHSCAYYNTGNVYDDDFDPVCYGNYFAANSLFRQMDNQLICKESPKLFRDSNARVFQCVCARTKTYVEIWPQTCLFIITPDHKCMVFHDGRKVLDLVNFRKKIGYAEDNFIIVQKDYTATMYSVEGDIIYEFEHKIKDAIYVDPSEYEEYNSWMSSGFPYWMFLTRSGVAFSVDPHYLSSDEYDKERNQTKIQECFSNGLQNVSYIVGAEFNAGIEAQCKDGTFYEYDHYAWKKQEEW